MEKPTTQTAVILAAGRGSRMRRQPARSTSISKEALRLAEKGLKGLIPVDGRPFLHYTVSRLHEAGIDRICFVVAPGADELHEYGNRAADEFGIRVMFALQNKPRGTADALLNAEEAVGNTDFLLCNCDNLYPQDALLKLVTVPSGTCAVTGFDRDVLLEKGNFSADRIHRFAVLDIDDEGNLVDIVEKPEDPSRYEKNGKLWLSMNLYRFTPAVFAACRRVRPHPERGELELTAAVSHMIGARQPRFHIVFSEGPVLDMTGKDDVLSVREAMANLHISGQAGT